MELTIGIVIGIIVGLLISRLMHRRKIKAINALFPKGYRVTSIGYEKK